MTMPRLTLILAGLAVASLACGDETVRPAPVDAGSGGAGGTTTTTSSSSTGGQPPTGTPIRSVEMRNPWGEVMDNHLVDGDFEFAVTLQGQQLQAGWFNFSTGYVRGETGGICKSGLRCAILEQGEALWGRGHAVRDQPTVAGLWVKPPPGRDCSVVTYDAATCGFDGAGEVLPVSPVPDETGWCEFRGIISELSRAGCVYIEAQDLGPGEQVIVDAASLLPDTGARTARKTRAVPPDRAERGRRAASDARRRQRFGRAPEGPPIPKR